MRQKTHKVKRADFLLVKYRSIPFQVRKNIKRMSVWSGSCLSSTTDTEARDRTGEGVQTTERHSIQGGSWQWL